MYFDQNTDGKMVLMMAIFDRGRAERTASLYAEEGVKLNFSTLCEGTAHSKIRNYLGLDDNEKELLFSLMPLDTSRILLQRLNEEMKLCKPGHGIAFVLPINAICCFTAAKYFKDLTQTEGKITMEQTFRHDLIIAIANRGFSDPVMDAARAVGATGGTVIHARGTGMKEAEKFFGITIQPEKELILILTPDEKRNDIMDAITTKAGLQTEAKALVFSLPVSDVAGLASMFPEEHK